VSITIKQGLYESAAKFLCDAVQAFATKFKTKPKKASRFLNQKDFVLNWGVAADETPFPTASS